MDGTTLAHAQADMRRGYLSGAPGALVSGLVWLAAGGVALAVSDQTAVWALLIGGALIHPLSLLVSKALGRPDGHAPGNPLGHLAGETTVLLIAGLVIAYAVSTVRLDWFFPTMLLVIGGRYAVFQTLYGLRTYWACGAALIAAGTAIGVVGAPVAAGALAGGGIEVATAAVLFAGARRQGAA